MDAFQITLLWLCSFAVFALAVLYLVSCHNVALKENEYGKGYEEGKKDGKRSGRDEILYKDATELCYRVYYATESKRYYIKKEDREYIPLSYLSSGNLFFDKKVALYWCDEMNKALLEGTTESTWERMGERDLLTIK